MGEIRSRIWYDGALMWASSDATNMGRYHCFGLANWIKFWWQKMVGLLGLAKSNAKLSHIHGGLSNPETIGNNQHSNGACAIRYSRNWNYTNLSAYGDLRRAHLVTAKFISRGQKKLLGWQWLKACKLPGRFRTRPHSSLHARYWAHEKALEFAIKRGLVAALLSVHLLSIRWQWPTVSLWLEWNWTSALLNTSSGRMENWLI